MHETLTKQINYLTHEVENKSHISQVRDILFNRKNYQITDHQPICLLSAHNSLNPKIPLHLTIKLPPSIWHNLK